MLTRKQQAAARKRAAEMLRRAGIAATGTELENMEIVELGLGELERTGVQIIVYENNDRYCAKELMLFPRQTCPEHKHPLTGDGVPGKMETFRCRWGKVWLYIQGIPSENIHATIPPGSDNCYTVFHEIELNPGEQYTVPHDTFHWFQAGDEGAIVSEFSSPSHDENDVFTDRRIKRITEIIDD